MQYYSGSPLYNYTLALELKRLGHSVTVLSNWAENALKHSLQNAGVQTVNRAKEEYDLAIVSQRDFPLPIANKIIHIVHSEYDVETPREGLDHYVAIRPTIKEHIVKEHNIPAHKVHVIYNGVDLERFKPRPKQKRNTTKIVIPATIDSLRQKFFDYYIKRADALNRVYFIGKQFDGKIPTRPHIFWQDEVHNIEDYIADADLVAGILLGRVNLEARAMDIPSRIHNPDNPAEYEDYYPPRAEFDDRHDIKKVAERLLAI